MADVRDSIDPWSLLLTVLWFGLYVAVGFGTDAPWPHEVAAWFYLLVYCSLGVYRPIRRRVPFYEWLWTPWFIAVGIYATAAGAPVYGITTAAFGAAGLAWGAYSWRSGDAAVG